MPRQPTIVWFRQDLRLADNPALSAAVEQGEPVIPVFVWAPREHGRWPTGAAARWWLHQALASLDADLGRLGSRLIIRQGASSAACLSDLVAETGATSVYYNHVHEPALAGRDVLVKARMHSASVEVKSFRANLLFSPKVIRTRLGRPFQAFTPFWAACIKECPADPPLPRPAKLPATRHWPTSIPLAQLGLEPDKDWADEIAGFWGRQALTERGATSQLHTFVATHLADYKTQRNLPAVDGTSRLSPYLGWGQISSRQVWHVVAGHARGRGKSADSTREFLRQLGWREFAYHLLCHFERTADEPLRREFARFPWVYDDTELRAWQQGRTGFPLVDAGMRQLWRIGWMHNRVRMVAASFLVKDLLQPWLHGAKWFWDTLVDADLANNTLGWQWVAGCGADAAPYFRVFNPTLQAERFDPEGDYVRRWLPELGRLPTEWIHRPADAPRHVLDDAGVRLGENYPAPIVDHAAARQRALAAFAQMRRR